MRYALLDQLGFSKILMFLVSLYPLIIAMHTGEYCGLPFVVKIHYAMFNPIQTQILDLASTFDTLKEHRLYSSSW